MSYKGGTTIFLVNFSVIMPVIVMSEIITPGSTSCLYLLTNSPFFLAFVKALSQSNVAVELN